MKTKIKIASIVMIVTSCFLCKMSFAQFNFVTSPLFNRYGYTNDGTLAQSIRSIGIGNGFTAANPPRAAFNINANFLLVSTGFPQGDVFRTDGPAAVTNAWRLYTGPTPGATQKGSLFVLGGSSDFQIQSPAGNLLLNSTGGFVGIGTLTPNNTLQVKDLINFDNANFSTSVGFQAGNVNVVGYNSFFGYQAGLLNTNGTGNVFVGSNSGSLNTSGGGNTFVGDFSGNSNSVGVNDTYVGSNAGIFSTGDNNAFFGRYSGAGPAFPSTGSRNTFLGSFCGSEIINGDDNTMVGHLAGRFATDGFRNVFVGKDCARNTTSGSDNVFLGYEAAFNNTLGNFNVAIGKSAGKLYTLGINNIFIGNNSDQSAANLNNAIAFGSNTTVTSSDKMILGDNNIWVGIGLSNDGTPFFGPGNSLEINSRVNGTGVIIPNSSGLRFRQLNANSPTVANQGNMGVLALSTSGDVILVPGGTGGGITSTCASINFIPKMSSATNLACSQFIDDGTTTGINVLNAATLFNVPVNATPILTSAGTFSMGGSGTASTYAAIRATSNVTSATSQIYGVRADVSGNGGSQNYGVMGLCSGSGFNFGGYFTANGAGGYGVYAAVAPNTGGLAGYFDGNVVRTGTDNFTSDRNLKQNIDTISNALQIVNLLTPKTFYFDTTAHPNMSLSSRKQWGFVAQDVETVLPELVGSAIHPPEMDTNGNVIIPALTYKTLNYQGFIAILMKGMQEQQKQIQSQKNSIDSLRTQMNSCCSSNTRTQNPDPSINQTNVTLDNSQNIVLNQNVPNPFAEQTTIAYNLPESVQKAQLLFYDATGKLIKSVDLTDRGKGQVNVFANDLSNGIYSYALVVDGQIADTKRMVKTN